MSISLIHVALLHSLFHRKRDCTWQEGKKGGSGVWRPPGAAAGQGPGFADARFRASVLFGAVPSAECFVTVWFQSRRRLGGLGPYNDCHKCREGEGK